MLTAYLERDESSLIRLTQEHTAHIEAGMSPRDTMRTPGR